MIGNTTTKVMRTDNLDKFRRLEGNRAILEPRLKKIMKSIEEVGYIMSPILVNDKWEVIDGQGRLEALKRLGMPVDYIMLPGIGINECRAMNIHQTNWGMIDYINSYAEIGNVSYAFLSQAYKAYGKLLGLGPVYYAFTGNYQLFKENLKQGNFKCTTEDYNKAVDRLEYAKRFVPIVTKISGRKEFYYMSIMFAFSLKGADIDGLYRKMKEKQAELVPVSNMEYGLGVIEELYNYRKSPDNKIYFITEYKKDLDRRRMNGLNRRHEHDKG